MKRVRSIVFWLHLAAGVVAGIVILVMAVTGALLALKPQILDVIEAGSRRMTPPPGASRLGVEALLATVRTERPEVQPATLTLQAEPTASAAVSLGRDGTIYVDPYSGRILGEGSKRAQQFFRNVEDWHRWLAVSGDNRATARAITGASNFAFFLLAFSGPYLWLPRAWSWSNVKAVIWFRPARSGRARDFNWHNVIGIWCAPVLIVLTLSGVVMSYPWANATLSRLAGGPVPVSGGGPGGPGPGSGTQGGRAAMNGAARSGNGEGRGGQSAEPRSGADGGAPGSQRAVAAPVLENLDASWARAVEQVRTWRSITARLPGRSGAPVTFTIVDSRSWNQFARSQLTVSTRTAEVIKWEPYSDQSRGQKWRGWVRFGHTGELAALPGQLIAGLACIGGAVLVWTGIALAFRRLLASRRTVVRAREAA